MNDAEKKILASTMEWYDAIGIDEMLDDTASSRLNKPANDPPAFTDSMPDIPNRTAPPARPATVTNMQTPEPLAGAQQAKQDAINAAQAANSLDELREAIANFEGLSVKKTATNMVFCDGHAEAPVMLIGEAPGADEDRKGRPFVGESGQLLDRMLNWIGINRHDEDPAKSIYISNILNWRPPGNRTPTDAEIEIARPFIEKHILLKKPRLLILTGGIATKTLLGESAGISRLRGKWHEYGIQTKELLNGESAPQIKALATYHPAYLLRNPLQKKAVWGDMLLFQKEHRSIFG